MKEVAEPSPTPDLQENKVISNAQEDNKVGGETLQEKVIDKNMRQSFPPEMFSGNQKALTHRGREVSLGLRSTEILFLGKTKDKEFDIINRKFLDSNYIACSRKTLESKM